MNLIEITDEAGTYRPEWEDNEPNPGSVVLVNGECGTAWQRYFSDGNWHSVRGGRGRPWNEMLTTQRNMVLAYGAPERMYAQGGKVA